MDSLLLPLLRTVHLLAMATWFGATLFAPGDLRRTLEKTNTDLELLVERLQRTHRVGAVAGWITLLSGVGLILSLGGFGAVPIAIHVSLLLGLITMGVGIFGVGRTLSELGAQVQHGRPRSELIQLSRRLSMMSGVFQSLWLVIFVLMVFRYHIG